MGYTFSREELYDLVWSEPLKNLAPRYGVSDTGLAKHCRKAGIPLPPRGYWAKLQAGKPVIQAALPPRLPGAHEKIEVSGGQRDDNWRENLLNNPLPAPPIFPEDLSIVCDRIVAMVGKVAYPPLNNRCHPLIEKILAQDAVRKKEFLESGYSWRTPLYDSPQEKRRLRILNAIFLAVARVGCKPSLDLSKYAEINREASLLVGDTRVNLRLYPTGEKKRSRKQAEKIKPWLSLAVGSLYRDSDSICQWDESDEIKLDKILADIVVEIILSGERIYRDWMQRQYDWKVELKSELEEEKRQRILAEKQRARELKKKQEKERIEKLLADAIALQQADTIRNYVDTVMNKTQENNRKKEKIEKWAAWALHQADKIDPVKGLKFLKYLK